MKNHTFLLTIGLLCLASCDEGRLYEDRLVVPEEGLVLKMTGNVSGIGTWADGYSVVVAGFSADSEYAVIAKNLPLPDIDGGAVEVVMAGISEEVTRLELCAIDRLRGRIAGFRTLTDFSLDAQDTIRMDVGAVDVSMFHAIQTTVFNTTCTACHGNSTSSAAGLDLREGYSFSVLVNQPSSVVSGALRVSPGQADASILYQVLATDLSTGWGYDHTREVLSTTTQTLIEGWIDNGATE